MILKGQRQAVRYESSAMIHTMFSRVTFRPSMYGLRSFKNWDASCFFAANSADA